MSRFARNKNNKTTIEEQIALRLPDELAQEVRQMVKKSAVEDVRIQFDGTLPTPLPCARTLESPLRASLVQHAMN